MNKVNNNNKLNLVRSVNKNVRSSTRKLKPILKSLVGKKVDFALRNLEFSNKRICGEVKKTLSSAIANAENNFQYDIDKLIIKEAYCGKQVVMKRFRARAKGITLLINSGAQQQILLHADQSYDITQEVIDAMNEKED